MILTLPPLTMPNAFEDEGVLFTKTFDGWVSIGGRSWFPIEIDLQRKEVFLRYANRAAIYRLTAAAADGTIFEAEIGIGYPKTPVEVDESYYLGAKGVKVVPLEEIEGLPVKRCNVEFYQHTVNLLDIAKTMHGYPCKSDIARGKSMSTPDGILPITNIPCKWYATGRHTIYHQKDCVLCD